MISMTMVLLGLKTLSLCAWLGVELVACTRCLNEAQVQRREALYARSAARIKAHLSEEQARGPDSCAQAVSESREEDVSRRSVSPWKYRLDRAEDRFPTVIPFAECLCQGCIMGRQENMSYNSWPVFVRLKVLKKSRCSSDGSSYAVTSEIISVPVGCTCIRPKVKAL